MMATVPHVTSGLGLRKFQADGFLLTRVYKITVLLETARSTNPINFTPIHRENPQAKTMYIISVITMKFV